MEKYYFKNGKEVHLGDKVSMTQKQEDPFFGNEIVKYTFNLTEEKLHELIERGIIVVVPMEEKTTKGVIPKDIQFYIEKLASKFGWKDAKMYNYLNTIDSIYPAAAFSLILREIAIELDTKYVDHIENSPEIYVISMFDGRITKANKKHIKNYRNFAAFRTLEDAKLACSITREVLKEMFKNGK